jgi:cytochrome c biogenesis protein CcdA
LLGPLFIFIGLFLLGFIHLRGTVGFSLMDKLNIISKKVGGKIGSFIMGVAFSLGFCPTMFWLFFGILMPLTLKSSMGMLFPPIFAIGTAIPLLLLIGLFLGFGVDRMIVKKVKNWGVAIQRVTGVFFILWGISDTYMYWTI